MMNSLLLTIPQSVGYEQNPLSLYYCYDSDDHLLQKCIAEVCFSLCCLIKLYFFKIIAADIYISLLGNQHTMGRKSDICFQPKF